MTEVIVGIVAFLAGAVTGVAMTALMSANGNDDDDYEQWKYFNQKDEEGDDE